MRLRLGIDTFLLLGPYQQALLGQLINQGQHSRLPLAQNRARTLVAAILGGPRTHLGSLGFGHHVNTVLTLFTPTQNVAAVKCTGGATTVGFATLAPEDRKS